jgi:glycosyltransferase involved in cell wall biosynthesis
LASDQIKVIGTVPDLWDYYNNSRVFIVPTRYAAGISLKLLEAMGHGLPSVVTPLIANQLNFNQKTFLIGNDEEQFANEVISCYTNESLWNDLRKNSFEYVQQAHSKEVFQSALNQLKQLCVVL